jgi:hypothetical protein
MTDNELLAALLERIEAYERVTDEAHERLLQRCDYLPSGWHWRLQTSRLRGTGDALDFWSDFAEHLEIEPLEWA